MRALTLRQTGGIDFLEPRDVPDPGDPAPGQVRIRVHAAALNRLDLFVTQGLPHTTPSFPHIVGSDAAGEVDSVGSGVTSVRAGDRVVVNPGLSCRRCAPCLAGEQPLCREYRILGEHLPGTLAEFLLVPEQNVAVIPAEIPWAEAAAFTLATLTAWRMLGTRARLQAGETVLVWGAGGGVAQASIQIATLLGARVIATSGSDAKLPLARELGAELVLNHRTEDVIRRVRDFTRGGVDVVVDTVGEATWPSSLRALRPMGRLVTSGATSGPQVALDIRKLFWFQWSILGSTMGNDAEFQAIVEQFRQGRLRPVVDSIVPLAQGPAAYARLAAGAQSGKLVIEVAA
ncbi:MAG: zinc-binding dehydrogenase [Gemmatimonadales bacterium]